MTATPLIRDRQYAAAVLAVHDAMMASWEERWASIRTRPFGIFEAKALAEDVTQEFHQVWGRHVGTRLPSPAPWTATVDADTLRLDAPVWFCELNDEAHGWLREAAPVLGGPGAVPSPGNAPALGANHVPRGFP